MHEFIHFVHRLLQFCYVNRWTERRIKRPRRSVSSAPAGPALVHSSFPYGSWLRSQESASEEAAGTETGEAAVSAVVAAVSAADAAAEAASSAGVSAPLTDVPLAAEDTADSAAD